MPLCCQSCDRSCRAQTSQLRALDGNVAKPDTSQPSSQQFVCGRLSCSNKFVNSPARLHQFGPLLGQSRKKLESNSGGGGLPTCDREKLPEKKLYINRNGRVVVC